MANKYTSLHVRKQHGKLTLLGMGRTNRGQKYIKATEEFEVSSMADKKFKSELSAKIEQMLG